MHPVVLHGVDEERVMGLEEQLEVADLVRRWGHPVGHRTTIGASLARVKGGSGSAKLSVP